MNTTPEIVAHYVENSYVSPRWVAEHYGVSLMRLHRATRAGLFHGCVVYVRSAGGRNIVLYDARMLPFSFPRASKEVA